MAWIATAALALLAAAAYFVAWRATRPQSHPLMRLDFDLGPDAVAAGNIPVAIAPDGSRIVFGMRGIVYH
jgi:hypothetical protein